MANRRGNRPLPRDVDRQIGGKIRELRRQSGLTIPQLAEKIGVTYQQLQKYEKGANRVASSRLFDIATALGVGIGEMFEHCGSSVVPRERAGSIRAIHLVRRFSRLPDRHQVAVSQLVATLAGDEEASDAG